MQTGIFKFDKVKATEDWIKANRINVIRLSKWQTRLQRGEIMVDIYHVNRKVHVIRHPDPELKQKRGIMGDDTIALLESLFNYSS